MEQHDFGAASRRRARHDHEARVDDARRGGHKTSSIDDLFADLDHATHRAAASDRRDPLDHWWEWDDDNDRRDDTWHTDTPKSSCPREVPSCSDCKWCSDPEGDVEGCVVVRIASALEDIAMVLGHISGR